MPSFISSFEEGRVKLSRNLPTETSFTDGKVERSVRDLSRRVTRSNSRLSLDGGEGEPEERSSDEEKDAKGNNNNNCNGGGGGGERRRASAVEILRRNFGVSKSPSLRLSTSSRMQQHDNHEGTVNSDVTSGYESECGECRKSERETGDAVTENEPTLSDLTSVEFITVPGPRRLTGDSEGNTVTSNESFPGKEHVYCTVYCIANDSHRNEITDDDTVTSDAPEMDAETGQDESSSPKPQLYTLDDLVDPFGDMAHGLSILQAGGAEATMQSCRVCLEGKSIAPLPCCMKAVCDECLKLYVSSQVRVAKSYISCPIPECSGYLEEGEVISHLANEDVAKYRYFLELSQLDSSTKPCPQCSQFTSLKEHNPNRSEHKYKIQCSNCQFVWCFKCHAPWHNGLKCRDYRKGDKLLRNWASVIEHGQRNAQKCPQCKIHIQRTEGCDHMTCTQCNTNFCYRCGERYRHLRFFGDHTSNLSVFGCKYRYLPDKPHLRRLIRGSVCATKVLIAPVVILLVVVLGALALVIGGLFGKFTWLSLMETRQQELYSSVLSDAVVDWGSMGPGEEWVNSAAHKREQGFLDSEPLREADEDFASQVNNSIMTEEEREEIQQELTKLEEEISTLKQVLSSKEKQHADLKQKLGINPLSELKNNFSRGWYDVQTSTA
ncbi:putative E3 ubiquitin-protein ligase RNF217 [Collichthys lucidus]|uniref:E3 ubiquitin-protein ligase RNF217 n=1 Tax=Collichthys lucidus TaxID=240159 RepID=A0A4U5UNJ8_COLLU|nr:putative E3 ubiquitin-protein ligase RNF217 [Collichthys lucidus]